MRQSGPFPGFPQASHRRIPHFRYLARAIVFQQLAWQAADTIWRRVENAAGGGIFPKPEAFLRVKDAPLRAAGLSRNKLLALQDLSAYVRDGALPLARAGKLPNEELIDVLCQVRGIGPWTAQMFLIFKLGRLDVMPSADLGVQEGLRRLDGLAQRPGPRELEERAVIWAPLRSVAAWTLWRLADGEAGDW